MQCPDDLKGNARKAWKKLFGVRFRPRNEVEVEASKRYVDWLLYFAEEKAVVAKDGTTVEGKNGVPYANPHFSNMKTAEDQMRRLWTELKKCMVEPQDDTQDLGEFGKL